MNPIPRMSYSFARISPQPELAPAHAGLGTFDSIIAPREGPARSPPQPARSNPPRDAATGPAHRAIGVERASSPADDDRTPSSAKGAPQPCTPSRPTQRASAPT